MWWKLTGLALLTAMLCLLVVPIRTHAVAYDPSNPPKLWTISGMFNSMYLTPRGALLIAVILSFAAFVAFKIIRGHW